MADSCKERSVTRHYYYLNYSGVAHVVERLDYVVFSYENVLLRVRFEADVHGMVRV